MRQYWLIITSPENFEIDRQNNFSTEGFKSRIRRTVEQVQPGDKFVIYVNRLQRIGAIVEATSGFYYDDRNKIWIEDDEIWPCRFRTQAELVLAEDELLDVKKVVPLLSFITPKQKVTTWGLAFQGSLRTIPEEDFNLIESEMRKIKSKSWSTIANRIAHRIRLGLEGLPYTEEEAKQDIMELDLEKRSLHDRICEMLATIGSRMEFNSYTNHKVTPDHAVELDVAWLQGKNPEVAIEVQIAGNIVEAKDKLAQAKKFNYRKVIIVIEESQLSRLNAIVKFDELIDWMEAWSIQAVYKLYTSGMSFLNLYERLRESRYKKKTEVEFVKE